MIGIRRIRRLRPLEQLAAWLVVALVVALERHGAGGVRHADVFSWLIGAIGFLADAAEFVISGVEMTLTAAVGWLVSSVGWIVGKLGDVVVSTGSIFSKTWDGLSGLWSNVVRPAIGWLSDIVSRFARWLQSFIQPLLDWARAVRDELLAIYRRFVAPILNALNIAKNILDLLAQIHIPFAAALDQYVAELEHWITEGYLKILGEVNKVLDTLNGLFTFDGLLQRFVLIRSVQRDWLLVQRSLLNPMNKSLTDTQTAKNNARWRPQNQNEVLDALAHYVNGGSNDTGDAVAASVDHAVDYFNAFDGSQAA